MTEPDDPGLHPSAQPRTEGVPSPSAPGPDCWLCVAVVGGAEPVWVEPVWVEPVWVEPVVDHLRGPAFRGAPVLASDGTTLVAIGDDGSGRCVVWSGSPRSLAVVGRLDHRLADDVRPVSLARHDGWWHLVVSAGQAGHRLLRSSDLVTWTDDDGFRESFPNLWVRGIAATSSGLVVLGEVVSLDRRIGWTLLDSQDGRWAPRELTFPLTAEHHVIGPVAVGDDQLALVVSSSAATLVARTMIGTGGRGWSLSLAAPPVIPTAATGEGSRVWLGGSDPSGRAPMLAPMGGRAHHLDRRGGDVVAMTAHRGELVLARRPGDAVHDPPAWFEQTTPSERPAGAVDDQSSPEYIASISAA